MNVTYLLGAGASSNCLPTYTNFVQRFHEFTEMFSINRSLYSDLDDEKKRLADSIRKKCDKLKDEFNYHNTPDTIAKKYFHKLNSHLQDLNDLKEVLILFFLYSQIFYDIETESKTEKNGEKRNLIDKRYDAFIASLLRPISGEREILNQFKILTWNYDLQFEKAFNNYETSDFITLQKKIQSIPRVDGDLNYSNLKNDRFSITHLNGIAYARPLNHIFPGDHISGFFNQDVIILDYLLATFKSIHYLPEEHFVGGTHLLTFAWENQNSDFSITNSSLLNQAKIVARQTEVLVIIGYSFPIFNNPTDRAIFKEMIDLRKIYIQSPQASEIIKILKSDFLIGTRIGNEDIVDLGYWHQFHIPNEWRLEVPNQYSIS